MKPQLCYCVIGAKSGQSCDKGQKTHLRAGRRVILFQSELDKEEVCAVAQWQSRRCRQKCRGRRRRDPIACHEHTMMKRAPVQQEGFGGEVAAGRNVQARCFVLLGLIAYAPYESCYGFIMTYSLTDGLGIVDLRGLVNMPCGARLSP